MITCLKVVQHPAQAHVLEYDWQPPFINQAVQALRIQHVVQKNSHRMTQYWTLHLPLWFGRGVMGLRACHRWWYWRRAASRLQLS